jgi:glycerate-2-kinase
MDWLCPGYSEVLAKQLTLYHGNITAINTIRDIVSIVQTGDLHVAIYDMSHDFLYVSNARGDHESGPLFAYDRTFVRLNTTDLFMEPAPNIG